MPILHILILALVQGITEFLPISSSGHLVLAHKLLEGNGTDLCWEQDRMLDIGVHIGTLASVLLYYRRDLWDIALSIAHPRTPGFRMICNIAIASVPVVIAGYAMHQIKPSFVCLLEIMAWMTIIFGVVLWVADRFFPAEKSADDMKPAHAFLIGLVQCLSLVPGVSRSGITMTGARFLGYSRTEAARFSLFLAIVATAGAGLLTGIDAVETGNMRLGTDMAIAAGLAFVSGYAAIALMIGWLKKATFTPFAIYRLILGAALLGLIYSGVL